MPTEKSWFKSQLSICSVYKWSQLIALQYFMNQIIFCQNVFGSQYKIRFSLSTTMYIVQLHHHILSMKFLMIAVHRMTKSIKPDYVYFLYWCIFFHSHLFLSINILAINIPILLFFPSGKLLLVLTKFFDFGC